MMCCHATQDTRDQLERLKDVGILPTGSIMVEQLTETKRMLRLQLNLIKVLSKRALQVP